MALRSLLAAVVAASVAVPMAGAAQASAVPAPAPAAVTPLDATPTALAARYAASRVAIAAASGSATDHGARARASSLRAMADPARRFLFFDGRDGGRSAEVFGDLSTADRIAVLVPGSDTNLDQYRRLRDGAAALSGELGPRAAVVAWLGYRTPATISVHALTADRAAGAAVELRRFVGELARARPDARLSVLGHSYGSVVCALAAPDLPVSDIVLYGSPGTGASTAAALRTRATVWAGRAAADGISGVPHLRIRLPFATLGFGTDPVSPEFGARVFDAGDGGHSDYLSPGTVSLRNIAAIVAGGRDA
ncbi:alpha/beta hydrolase [Longispora sp. K20-0274]|uniref:alpha/beta hydrolase n=1 Tax=Longispora sp. K20-0274 TaxID=3088255 RepID=UPI00399B9919